MLVLSRKLDESIKIGNDIKITILRVKGNTIRIGIDAPSDVRVIRSELKAVEADPVADASQVEAGSTVTAIVDSPSVASTRLFVGKVTRTDHRGSLDIVLNDVDSAQNARATTPASASNQIAPLRSFLRRGHGLTAV